MHRSPLRGIQTRHGSRLQASRTLAVGAVLALLAMPPLTAQDDHNPAKPDAAAIVDAVTHLGAGLRTIRYSASGTVHVAEPGTPLSWTRIDTHRYEVAIDYPMTAMRIDIAAGNGMTSAASQARSSMPSLVQLVSGNVAWNLLVTPELAAAQAASRRRPRAALPDPSKELRPDAVFERRLAIWVTPHGFLKAALSNQPALRPAGSGTDVSFYAGRQRYVGFVNSKHEVERVRTWVAEPDGGETVIDTSYTHYAPFGTTHFPTRIVQRRGVEPTLDLTVTTVQTNLPVDIVHPPLGTRR
jgi:hypothetical protein